MLVTGAGSPVLHPVMRFDNFEANLASGELRRDGIRLGLRDQSFRVLATLLQHAGEVVTREELRELLWNGKTFVDFDNNLNAVVGHLREVLSDSADHPRFIETLPKHGYRFVAPVCAPRENGANGLPTKNLLAYNEYIQGRCEMWNWTAASVAKAKRHFEAATQLDPDFALVYDALANFHWYLGFWGFLPPLETEPIRRFYAQRAIELDPSLPETQTLIAFRPEKCSYEETYAYNWIETEKKMVHARNLAPTSVQVRVRYASVLMVLERYEQAIAELRAAQALDPRSLEVSFWLVETYFFAHQWTNALGLAQEFVAREPDFHIAYLVLAHALLAVERWDETVNAMTRACELSGNLPVMLGWLGLALGKSGQHEEARRIQQQLRQINGKRFVLPSSFAWVHLGLGETDEAFAWMKRAIAANDGWMPAIKSYPFVRQFEGDVRLQTLVRSLSL